MSGRLLIELGCVLPRSPAESLWEECEGGREEVDVERQQRLNQFVEAVFSHTSIDIVLKTKHFKMTLYSWISQGPFAYLSSTYC